MKSKRHHPPGRQVKILAAVRISKASGRDMLSGMFRFIEQNPSWQLHLVQYDSDFTAAIGTEYDIVCANIVADVLIGMSDKFAGFLKENGKLIISGIIDSRKDEVLDVIKAKGFELTEIREKEDWVAASFIKK